MGAEEYLGDLFWNSKNSLPNPKDVTYQTLQGMVQRFFSESTSEEADKEANNWLVIFMALLISFRIMTYF